MRRRSCHPLPHLANQVKSHNSWHARCNLANEYPVYGYKFNKRESLQARQALQGHVFHFPRFHTFADARGIDVGSSYKYDRVTDE